MNQSELTFACERAGGSWTALFVASVTGQEALSSLFRYELSLLAPAGGPEIAPADLVGGRASLRIATLASPAYRVVHGIVTEAKELDETAPGMLLRVVLAPPWARALHRKRYRIFLDKTLRQIVEAVLTSDPLAAKSQSGEVAADEGDASWSPAAESFTWRVAGTSRLDDARARAYCVQYGESDQEFVARLLEEEGISYHFEHGDGTCLLVLSDHDGGRARLDGVVGPGLAGRELSAFQLGARLRPGSVVVGDYDWKKPSASMLAEAAGGGGGDGGGPTFGQLAEKIYPGGYADSPAQGVPLATARADRYAVEARTAAGKGTIRLLSAGTVLRLEHPKARYEGEYLVTELRVRAEQKGEVALPSSLFQGVPFEAEVDCARRGRGDEVRESRFRPARATPAPRIRGTQSAVVTADPSAAGAEIVVGGPDGLSIGCVRVRFHWDDDAARHEKEPTSCWVRVSQAFASAGEGSVWHPRVGTEVLVDFEEGSPDRPIVVGRVYNGKNLPPYGGSPTHSVFKSMSTPGGAVWNEVSFDDTAGSEKVFMNAGKDMKTVVENERYEEVGAAAKMIVGGSDTEEIGANQAVSIGADDTLGIGADDSLEVGANSTTTIAASCTSTIGGSQTKTIGASHTITVGGPLTETVAGAVAETYASTRDTTVSGAAVELLAATRSAQVAGSNTQQYASQVLVVGGNRTVQVGSTLSTTVGGTVVQIVLGSLTTDVTGTQTSNVAGGMMYLAPKHDVLVPDSARSDDLQIKVTGIKTGLYGVDLSAVGLGLSISGMTATAEPFKKVSAPLRLLRKKGMKAPIAGLKVSIAGLWLHRKGFTCIL